MRRTGLLQEIRKMRFEEAYERCKRGRLTQEEAARLLGVCDRTYRRYVIRYEEQGMEGLVDRRLGQISHRRAPRYRRDPAYSDRPDDYSKALYVPNRVLAKFEPGLWRNEFNAIFSK